MNKDNLKKLIYITLLMLVVVLSYKIYLFSTETDFQGSNLKNIQLIQESQPTDSYSFTVVGSAANSIDIFRNIIIKGINSDKDISFMISTGDSQLDGAEDKYRAFNKSLKLLKVPSVIGVGNTEISDGGKRRFPWHYGPFYSSFDYGDNYFILIDTTGATPFEVQKVWIASELTKADSYMHTFIFMNDSPLKTNDKNAIANPHYIKNKAFSNFLIDEFSGHNVTGVFINGTVYEESKEKGVSYYSSGGAGGLLLGNSPDNNYHYLKVDVSSGKVIVSQIKIPSVSKNVIIRNLEKIWVFIHSIFYFQFVNLLVILFAILLLFLLLYKKVSRDVNYYRNFNNTDVDVNLGKKLNIAMFTNNYFPFVGGVPISIDRLAIGLRKRGNSVELFAPRYPEAIPNESNVHRCNLLYYAKTGKFNYAIANIFSREISQKFNKGNFDIVHAHHPFWMGKRGLKLGIKSNIPVVLTYHTRLEMYFDNLPSFKMLFKNILSHRIIRRFAQKCDGIIAPTVSAMEYLENIGVSKQKIVLPTGIDNNCYNVKDAGELINGIRNSYAPSGQALLCSVSRLAVEKNIDFLIRGLCAVKENTQTKFKCIIIGDGPERASIEKLIDDLSLRNEVTLIGKVNPGDIAEYYQASDLFVFSSLSETQGMVLLEAMAGSCPVVCVKSSGTDDVVENGFNGYKTPEDTEEWSKKIIYLLENRDVLEMMSSNSFSYSKDFSLDKMAERVEMFYKKLIAAK